MSLESLKRNVGRRYPDWVIQQVMALAGAGVNQAQLGIAAEIARQVGASAGVISRVEKSPGEHGVVLVGFASDSGTVDVAVHPDGGVSVSCALGGDGWQGEKAAELARVALWGRR